MLNRIVRRLSGDERGISAVVVVVCLVAIFGAAMLSVDAGSLWTTRRTIVTGTDASVLDAADYFNGAFASQGLTASACDSSTWSNVEQHATTVLTDNSPSALHNSTVTPGGFTVTPAPTVDCNNAPSYVPGKVRYDGRLIANQTFSKLFGFYQPKAFSSSTAAWGYITGLGKGLRPIAICDQRALENTVPGGANLPPAPDAPDYPHYHLWRLLNLPTSDPNHITQAQYDSYWGSDDTGSNDAQYPKGSWNYVNGDAHHNPNRGQAYINPANDSRFHTVHRIMMPDPKCGQQPGNLAWVDLQGTLPSQIGASDLKSWIQNGYPGTVSLTPHDCNPSDSLAPPENCGARPGDVSSLDTPLAAITCPVATPASQCPVIFPIIVANQIVCGQNGMSCGGSVDEYVQVAFLYVVMRGYSGIVSTNMEFDFEFVRVQTTGLVGGSPPDPNDVSMTGIQLCGVDNDPYGADHCPF